MATLKNQQKNRRNGRSQKQQNKKNNSTQKRRNLSKNQKKNKSSKRQQNKKQRRQTQRKQRVGGASFVGTTTNRKRGHEEFSTEHSSPFQDPECLMYKENMTRIKGILDQKFLQQLNTLKQGATNAAGTAQNMQDENERSTHRIALMLVKTNHRVYFPDRSTERGFLDKVKELVFGLPYIKVDTNHQTKPQLQRTIRDEINKHLAAIESEYQEISEINANTGRRANGGRETTHAKIKRYNQLLTNVGKRVTELKTSLSRIEGVEQRQIHVAQELLGDALITITIPPEAIITAYKLVFLKAYMKREIGNATDRVRGVIQRITSPVVETVDQGFEYLLEQRLRRGEYGDNPLPDMINYIRDLLSAVGKLSENYDKEITDLLGKALEPVPNTPQEEAREMAYSDEQLGRMNFRHLVSLLNQNSIAFFDKCLAPNKKKRGRVDKNQGYINTSIHDNGTASQPTATPFDTHTHNKGVNDNIGYHSA
jgi:hypothetical protein